MNPIRRVDRNQSEIVLAFRKLGCSVLHLHQIGRGCPDILVGLESAKYGKINILVEIKDGKKNPSQRRLTPDQVEFHKNWQGFLVTVNCVEDVVTMITTLQTR